MLKKTKTHSKLPPTHHGEIRHTFLAPEFLEYQRGPLWYLAAGSVILTILAVGILTNTLTLVLAISLFVAVYWILHHQKPQPVEITITDAGLKIGQKFFAYPQIKHFWLHWNPPYVTDLKLEIHRKFQPVLTIHALGQDAATLRQILLPHLTETSREEPLTDFFIRICRL